MRSGCEDALLRALASMPFLDRLELAAVSGWSRGAVYAAAGRLEEAGLASSFSHATGLIPPARRYYLTADGLRRLAWQEALSVDGLLQACPVSERWRRILLERLDAVAAIYRLAAVIANSAFPIRFQWYRAGPLDAAIALPGGRTVGVVRQGATSDRTAFAKRLWRLRDSAPLSAYLLLTPDAVRLRHTRRLAAGMPAIAFLALERDAVCRDADDPVWRTPSGAALLGLRTALSHARPGAAWPPAQRSAHVSLPDDLSLSGAHPAMPGWSLPVLLRPAEKRTLDLLADWPWIGLAHLGVLLGVNRSRSSHVLQRLDTLGLTSSPGVDGRHRLALSDRGLALLARRDRAAVGAARKRWSVAPLDPDGPRAWRNVSGRRSRQLLRNIEHTQAVHWFVAALARQARAMDWEVVQLDPPQRASRYFRHEDGLRSIHPDAFGLLRRDGKSWSFFLEWERRAVRPVTMASRIAPYLRYFSTRRPIDDHGFPPAVLVVFDDELAATHFLRVAREEMKVARIELPLRVSHRSLLERVGPLGPAWRATGLSEPGYAVQSR